MAIDWTKPVQTINGKKVRVLCIDGPDKLFPVIGIVDNEPLRTYVFNLAGESAYPGLNLINIPVKHTVWLNVYKDGFDGNYALLHQSKVKADRASGGSLSRLACVKIEYVEGEGLNND